MAVRPKDSRPHVIVVEDEQFQRETLVDFLDENGFRPSGVDSGAALRKLVEKDPPALVLLDLRLPGSEDGFALARFLRERSRRMGIIMLTAASDTVDQVVGLETGADDYIAKPYYARELLARLKAVLRRQRAENQPPQYLAVGGLRLAPAKREVAFDGELLDLTVCEFDLLESLMRSRDAVATKDELSLSVLGRKREPYDRSIDVHVSNLRKKLCAISGKTLEIETVRAIGYRLKVAA